MMIFNQPWFLLLPLIALLLWYFRRPTHAAVLCASVAELATIGASFRARLRSPVLFLLSLAALIGFSLALSQPRSTTTLIQEKQSRNLMIALDVSKSMGTEDFSTEAGDTDRLSGVKQVVAEFIAARLSDRIGVVVFGSNAFLQAPLTRDHPLLLELIDKLQIGIAGDGTEMGDGLALSLKRMVDIRDGTKAVILLTDGVNSSGPAKPLEAAKIAKQLGIKVHTIGIGSNRVVRGNNFPFGIATAQQAEFDEKTLRQIAEETGGVYFHAGDRQALTDVYEEIDKLEKTDDEEPEHEIVTEHFSTYLQWGLLGYLCLLLLSSTVFMKVP